MEIRPVEKNEIKFPKGFFFGAATSAHQVEGGNHNDWSEWEKENAVRLSKETGGKYPPSNYISGKAADHYNRFREDFDIAKSLGHNAHRFSIEWSRIQPLEGVWVEKEINHYRDVIKSLRERGIEPFVTLWHWTIPLWLRDKGGVASDRFPEYFHIFAARMAHEFPDVKFWMTLNEPTSVIANSYLRGIWPPQKKSIFTARRVYKILAQAHREAYYAIHIVNPDAQVGFGNIMVYAEPYSINFEDRFAAKFRNYFSNEYFLKLTGNTHDYYALQYYFHFKIKFPQKIMNENKWVSDMGWEIYPEGIFHLLEKLVKFKKPIYITENGVADAKDIHREKFIKEHLEWVSKAMHIGADVRGYFYWSLLDNFEWDKGFWPRFGLVEVDYKTMERKIRPSAKKLTEIIKGL